MTQNPEMPVSQQKVPRNKAFKPIMALMGLNILLGLGIALAGHLLLESDGMALVGAGLATLAAIVMLSYQLWGDKS